MIALENTAGTRVVIILINPLFFSLILPPSPCRRVHRDISMKIASVSVPLK